jgi:AcrR family transcriptional regulator
MYTVKHQYVAHPITPNRERSEMKDMQERLANSGTQPSAGRARLSRDRVLRTAMALADKHGLQGLTMRNVAQALSAAPMALYRHVANKEDLVDGLIDLVFAELSLPSQEGDWKAAMRDRAHSVREALLRHRWAVGILESSTQPGPANLRHHDAVIGSLRAAGFDMAMVAHAYAVLDSYIYGFAQTEMNLPIESMDEVAGVAQEMLEAFSASEYPNLVAFTTQHIMKPGYDYGGDEFDYGLALILEGLDRALQTR